MPSASNQIYDPGKDELHIYRERKQQGYDDMVYLSFGDSGTTATITEWGQIVQISQYLGYGRSGIVSMESSQTAEPYMLNSRKTALVRQLREMKGFGSEIWYPDYDSSPVVSWVQNKWPRIVFESNRSKLVLQYAVKNGVVIQETFLENTSGEEMDVSLSAEFDILTRELDFLDKDNKPNEGGLFEGESIVERMSCMMEGDYANGHGPGGYGFIQIHETRNLQEQPGEVENDSSEADSTPGKTKIPPYPDAVAAVWGFFINGQAWTKAKFDRETKHQLKHGEKFHIITAYKLVLVPAKDPGPNWRRLTISAADADIHGFLQDSEQDADVQNRLSNLDLFQFPFGSAIARNVEHILSVCAMPVTNDYVWDTGSLSLSKAEFARHKVAITQGEMAFHKISARESYFAIKLLLDVAKKLQPGKLKSRIKLVCRGHLNWVFKVALSEEGRFFRDYWVSGKPRSSHCGSNSVSEDAPIITTPLHILKAYEYFITFDSEADRKDLNNLIDENSLMGWLKWLDSQNKLKAYAWCHNSPGDVGIDYFRLGDHIWIHNALAAIKVIKDWKIEIRGPRTPGSKGGDNQASEDCKKKLKQMYDPKRVRREIVRRFTTTIDAKQRMIAVTRSARENRFQFHATDTVLFYSPGDLVPVLPDDNSAWRASLEAHGRFFPNKFLDSAKLLHHGLCMLLAKKWNSTIAIDPEDCLSRAADVIAAGMLTNGLFPSQIGDSWLNESAYSFETSFEVPCILWLVRPGNSNAKGDEVTSEETPAGGTKEDKVPAQIVPVEIAKEGKGANEETLARTTAKPDAGRPPENLDPLDGAIPFNHQINEKSVINVAEEWLYNRPIFFNWEPTIKTLDEALNSIKGEIKRADTRRFLNFTDLDGEKPNESKPTECNQGSDENANNEGGAVVASAIEEWSKRESGDQYEPLMAEGHNPSQLVLLDVGKKSGSKIMKQTEHQDRKLLGTMEINKAWDRLKQIRDETTAKKRLLWLERPLTHMSLMCYLPAPQAEQGSISSFFDRHATYLNFFEDKPNRVMNTWETEFHCKFLQIVDPESDSDYRKHCPMLESLLKDPLQIGPKVIIRASASFRILGDFFDKFWTCLFVENYPGTRPEHLLYYLGTESQSLPRVLMKYDPSAWQQRNVLEPIFLHRILSEVNRSTKDILKEIEDCIDQNKKQLGQNPIDVYFDSHLKWSELHKILDILKAHLDDMSKNLKDWSSREQDRMAERPRWTSRDEQKYRHSITAIELLNQRALRDLHGHRSKADAIEKALELHKTNAKNEYNEEMSSRGFHQNENIQYFTYSTVFFLPLGFATSIYSMSGAPPSGVIWKMVVCAMIALLVLMVAIRFVPTALKPFMYSSARWTRRSQLGPTSRSANPSTESSGKKPFEPVTDDNEAQSQSDDQQPQGESPETVKPHGKLPSFKHQASFNIWKFLALIWRNGRKRQPPDVENSSANAGEGQPEPSSS
ncbi:unnamed protein product [Penicillium bialowiezense]